MTSFALKPGKEMTSPATDFRLEEVDWCLLLLLFHLFDPFFLLATELALFALEPQ